MRSLNLSVNPSRRASTTRIHVVAVWSEQQRPNLQLELGMAMAKGLRIIPVLVADAELPSDLKGLRYVHLRRERNRGLEELVRAAI
jgi:predicted nucleotide-binding protein